MSEEIKRTPELLRIVESLQDRYDRADKSQHLRPVYLMALGMAATKIIELEKKNCSVDAIDLSLDEEIEELMIIQAHNIIVATAEPFPWRKNILTSVLGGFGAVVLTAATFAFLKYAETVGLITHFW